MIFIISAIPNYFLANFIGSLIHWDYMRFGEFRYYYRVYEIFYLSINVLELIILYLVSGCFLKGKKPTIIINYYKFWNSFILLWISSSLGFCCSNIFGIIVDFHPLYDLSSSNDLFMIFIYFLVNSLIYLESPLISALPLVLITLLRISLDNMFYEPKTPIFISTNLKWITLVIFLVSTILMSLNILQLLPIELIVSMIGINPNEIPDSSIIIFFIIIFIFSIKTVIEFFLIIITYFLFNFTVKVRDNDRIRNIYRLKRSFFLLGVGFLIIISLGLVIFNPENLFNSRRDNLFLQELFEYNLRYVLIEIISYLSMKFHRILIPILFLLVRIARTQSFDIQLE